VKVLVVHFKARVYEETLGIFTNDIIMGIFHTAESPNSKHLPKMPAFTNSLSLSLTALVSYILSYLQVP